MLCGEVIIMNGLIIFKNPLTGLVDTAGAAITESVARMEIIPKHVARRLRVVISLDTQNQRILKVLALFLELPGSAASTEGGAGLDLVLLAKLDNPVNKTIQNFFIHVDAIKSKLASDIDEEIIFRNDFT